MAQNENISLSLANKIDILNKSQSLDARYGVYDDESSALSAMLSYGLDGRQVAVYTDKPNGKVKLYLYNQVEHKLEPTGEIGPTGPAGEIGPIGPTGPVGATGPTPEVTVTSVGLQVPEGFEVSNSPITSSGTLEIDHAAGYQSYTTEEADKLASIEEGAEVNVNADWNATSGDAEILNKPTIPEQVNLIEGDNIDITGTYPNITISATGGGGSVSWDEITGDQSDINLSGFTNDLGLATVSTTGDYGDLSNTPTIPTELNDLSDVNVGGQSDKDVLVWSSVDSYFTPVPHIGQGGGAHALATGSTAGFISGENQAYLNELKEVTSKRGTNFQTVKFIGDSVGYTGAGTHDLVPTFKLGSNIFSSTEYANNAIYEGQLVYTIDHDGAETTNVEITFDSFSIEVAEHHSSSTSGVYLVTIDFMLIFTAAPDEWNLTWKTVILTPNADTFYTYPDDDDYIPFTPSGSMELSIEANSDAGSASYIQVLKSVLKRIN